MEVGHVLDRCRPDSGVSISDAIKLDTRPMHVLDNARIVSANNKMTDD